MAKWSVSAKETVLYDYTVEAETETEAWEKAENHSVSENEIVDSYDWEVFAVKRAEEDPDFATNEED